MPQLIEDPSQYPSQEGKPVGQDGSRRFAGSGDVEANHRAVGSEVIYQGLQDVEAGADAVAQHQRNPTAVTDPHSDAWSPLR